MTMTLDELKKIVAQGESDTLELKKSTSLLPSASETTCAFLNGKGGIVLIGVTDAGKILGQNVTDHTRQEVANHISKLEPPAQAKLDIEYVAIDDNKYVIAINIAAGNHKPYTYDGRAFMRNQTITTRMPQHRLEQLIVERGQLNHSWETFVSNDYTIDSLDHEEIYRTVMDGIAQKRIPPSAAKLSIKKILQQLELLTKEGQLKNAAVILFAKEIKSPYTQCWLKMARFKGKDNGGDFIDNQQEHCNVFRMLEAADNFFRKHLPMASIFKQDQFKRIDKFSLPVLAVREALINAMCHKNYAMRAGYISIAIFDHACEIWNNGTLPSGLEFSDLKHEHPSILRNELIAKIFYLRGYIESWGTGIKKMVDSCKEHGIPKPKFSERVGGFLVKFQFAEPIGGYKKKETLELTKRQQEILKFIKEHSLNAAQIFAKLKDAPTVRMVQIDLTKLEKNGLVIREGESRSTTWKACDNSSFK